MHVRFVAFFIFGLLTFFGSWQSAFASTIFSQTPSNESLNGPILNSPYLVMFGCTGGLNGCGAYGKVIYNIGVWIKKVGNPADIRLQVVDTFAHYPANDSTSFSNSVSASSISSTSYTLKWFYFPNGVVISTNQFFLFQFTGANNTANATDYYQALYDPINSYNAVSQWCKIYLGCNSSRFFWKMDDENIDLSLPPPPSITLLGNATTTAEFGSTFTDPGATAQDSIDGNITSAIQITGSVNTNVMGTTTLTYSVTNSHGLSATTTRAVVVACTHDCYSNVLFLPGIEGSRLYEGQGANCTRSAGEKLWEPLGESVLKILLGAGDDKTRGLFLDATGASLCGTVYAKTSDIIDAVGGSNIYKSFIDEMNRLKTDGSIREWKSIAYDWRLSLDDLLSKGAEHDGGIFYEEATSTPYIEQTLRALAAGSKTGKVSIVAHSNGGLVAKALLNKLENQLGGSTSKLVDKVIMVGVPQTGAPLGVGALLFGQDQGISSWGVPILHSSVARELAQNSPMAYHLLPSQSYFDSVMNDPAHPVARFAGDGYAKEISAYGSAIGNLTELSDFLLAHDGGREKPAVNNVNSAEIVNPTLISYANDKHTTLDSWVPSAGIEVSQIAGWGADTLAGIDFYTPPAGPQRLYRPIQTEDGDGTVPVPSALLMSTSTSVKRYWVNLDSYRKDTSIKRSHKDLFEIPALEDFIKNIIKSSTSSLPAYISASQPPVLAENKNLTFYLHSPLTLQLTDSLGNITGLAEDGSMTQNIPGSSYGEFGEVKYVTVPQGSTYTLSMHGQASGTFSLDMQESSGGVVTNSSTIASVPQGSTLASLTISDGINTASPLTVDKNGDGNTFTITPKVGETVNYEPPTPVPESRSGSGGGGSYSTIAVPTTVATTTEQEVVVSTATTSQTIELQVATSTPVAVAPAKPVQAKKKVALTAVQPKKASIDTSQTASVYEASQQPVLNKLGGVVYYSLHSLDRATEDIRTQKMKTKITQSIPALLALLIIGFRYFSQWCIGAEQICFRTLLDRMYLYITNPVFYFAIFFLPVAIILAFVSRGVFNSWLRLALWAIPLSILYIAIIPDSNPGAYMDFFPFYRDDAARVAGGIFAALSLVLIICRALRSAHTK